jgi:hypothetical protein
MITNVGNWTSIENSLFTDSVVAHGWGKWKEIADNFVTSRNRTQVSNHGFFLERNQRLVKRDARGLMRHLMRRR